VQREAFQRLDVLLAGERVGQQSRGLLEDLLRPAVGQAGPAVGVAAGKRTAADLGAHICFEDEAGQGLRPPKGHTWAPRGARPVVRVRGRNQGRVNIAGVVCYRAGQRSRFFFKLHISHGHRGELKAFSWRQYRDLVVVTHIQLGTPVVWCWDNLNVHLVKDLADFAEEHQDWLQIFQMPSYSRELNPADGIWSLLKRHLADFAAATSHTSPA
jgi:hypothetical protein